MLIWLRKMPGCSKLAAHMAFRRMTLGYDIARGFVQAQDEMLSHVHELAPSKAVDEKVREDILANKRDTFGHIEQLRQCFPEVIRSLETGCTLRILLNRERHLLKKMHENAILAKPEAEKLLEQVEQKMHDLSQTPIQVAPPIPCICYRIQTGVRICRYRPWSR
ncbi:hypothetical protein [Dongshaea marina]|uniref:hypothetical protein n=1 Tax=Dongshaea marina TaxID=2047966 RepID=UPI001901D0B9|nr:hypothetical protein [Dongshaea marina]